MNGAAPTPSARYVRRLTRVFFALAFVPMFLVFPYLRAINNPNENVRVFTTMALVHERSFSIDTEVGLYGWVNDMAHVKKADGQLHYYMVKGPGAVYAALPGYWLFTKAAHALGHDFPTAKSTQEERLWWLRWSTWACRLWAVQLPCFVFLIWFERFLRDYSRDVTLRLSTVAAAGLGTNYLAYVHLFASHALFAVCSFVSFAIALRELQWSRGNSRRARPSRAFLCGWFASACVMLEYHSLFLVVILCLFGIAVFWRLTRALAFLAGGITNVPLVMWFQWRAYNNPLTPGHKMLETQMFAEDHAKGLWGVVWPSWDHVSALILDPGFGLFGTSPFLILAVLAVPFVLLWPREVSLRMRRSLRVATLVWFVAITVLVGVNAGIVEWRAGWTIGPRYLGAAPPFCAFGALTALESFARRGRLHRTASRALVGGLAMASVLTIGVVGIMIDTLPDTIVRPFAQIAIPLARTGFVPHHLAEWLGYRGTAPWYLALGCLVGAAVVAGFFARQRERPVLYGTRLLLAGAVFCAGMIPAFKPPEGTEKVVIPSEVGWFMSIWEPAGRDRLTALREAGERYGPRRPCIWYKLADLERMVNLQADAERDEKRANGAPRDKCATSVF